MGGYGQQRLGDSALSPSYLDIQGDRPDRAVAGGSCGGAPTFKVCLGAGSGDMDSGSSIWGSGTLTGVGGSDRVGVRAAGSPMSCLRGCGAHPPPGWGSDMLKRRGPRRRTGALGEP